MAHYKRRKKSERNTNGGLYPKIECSHKTVELSCENTYYYRPILKRGRCSMVRSDGMVSIVFQRKIDKIRGDI